jgi:tRNA pseudouridine65 synthase
MQSLSGSAHLYRMDTLYEDDQMIIVNKPSGIAVHRGWDNEPVNATKLIRKLSGRRAVPVHRLDRATSGVLVFAFDGGTAGMLQDHFRDKTIDKRYLALVRGVTPEGGVIDHPVPKKIKGPRVDAVTRFARLGVIEDRYSLVEAYPETGRTHQIRRHLKHLNHPLIGDTRYGDGKENRRFRSDFGLLRLALHAVEVRFRHPHSGEALHIVAPPPDDLRVPLERMGFAPEAYAPTA